MQVRDRRKLAHFMAVWDVSQRELARSAGWRSHSYVGRILRGDITTVTAAKAVAISKRLDVPVEVLFLPRVYDDAERKRGRNRTGRRVASGRQDRGAAA